MTRHVLLLRGINVGGRNKLPMADLRATLEGAGFDDVSTYIQSGNVALSAERCEPEFVSGLIARDFDLDIPVVIRSEAELRSTVADNPFPDLETEPKRLMVYFCGGPIPAGWDDTFDYQKYEPDRVSAGNREIYVAYRKEGMSSSKLANPVLDRAVGQPTTARNWSTVQKLLEMAADV